MQDRRYRPGDVLDDYCPRERRITDHAIVAMIDDEIRRTRCGICDAEHEYKEGKVPTPRRKTQPPALFNQVLEGMNGPVPPAPAPPAATAVADAGPVDPAAAASEPAPSPPAPSADRRRHRSEQGCRRRTRTRRRGRRTSAEGGFRRSLIRATFPRPEGQAPPPRANPEFTIQSLNNRRNNSGQRHAGGQNKFRGGRRRPGAGGGSRTTSGRCASAITAWPGSGPAARAQGQEQGGGGRRRRGGKKNR